MVEVLEELNPAQEQEVRSFLATGPRGAGGEHDPAWLRVLREGLGHRPFALVARSSSGGGPITGYLPLALVKSRLFGRFLVSLPYLNMVGVASNEGAAVAELIDEAVRLAERHNVQYLELRHGDPRNHSGFNASRDEKVRMVLDLPANEEALKKSLGSKLMAQVRKGDKSELTLKWGGLDVLDGFYDVFAVNMRDLGTPVYSRKLFASILNHLDGRAELAVVEHQGQAIAGALLCHHGAMTAVPSASALRAFNHTSANMWMYHQLLLRAIAKGSRQFDFGRSSVDSGTYRFKAQWGAKPQPTVWQYHVRFGDVNAVRPTSEKNQRRVEQWKKLPVWLTRLIGPAIVRGIP
jgi:serine/alanine adding enzyme